MKNVFFLTKNLLLLLTYPILAYNTMLMCSTIRISKFRKHIVNVYFEWLQLGTAVTTALLVSTAKVVASISPLSISKTTSKC